MNERNSVISVCLSPSLGFVVRLHYLVDNLSTYWLLLYISLLNHKSWVRLIWLFKQRFSSFLKILMSEKVCENMCNTV